MLWRLKNNLFNLNFIAFIFQPETKMDSDEDYPSFFAENSTGFHNETGFFNQTGFYNESGYFNISGRHGHDNDGGVISLNFIDSFVKAISVMVSVL
jgi:hypothetical protein